MDSENRPLLTRVVAIVVIVVAAAIAIRLIIGFVAGILSALLWVVCVVAIIAALLWARSVLKRPRRSRDVERPSRQEVTAPAEDPVAAEMRKLTEQLRDQGRM
jgi:uncharacterized membrane protein